MITMFGTEFRKFDLCTSQLKESVSLLDNSSQIKSKVFVDKRKKELGIEHEKGKFMRQTLLFGSDHIRRLTVCKFYSGLKWFNKQRILFLNSGQLDTDFLRNPLQKLAHNR
jgi:hypothetical protein